MKKERKNGLSPQGKKDKTFTTCIKIIQCTMTDGGKKVWYRNHIGKVFPAKHHELYYRLSFGQEEYWTIRRWSEKKKVYYNRVVYKKDCIVIDKSPATNKIKVRSIRCL